MIVATEITPMDLRAERKLEQLCSHARDIRCASMRALRAAGSGHVGGAMSAADLLAALYFDWLRIDPSQPDWTDRDRFVLSKGHGNAALSAVLALAGFFPLEDLDRFYGMASPLGMHPDIKVPGMEMSTGGLGHGLSIGVGMALGAARQARAFRTVVMLGDGELQEGSNWEAAMSAAHFKLDQLVAIVDFNKVQQSGDVATMMQLEPLDAKWSSFGWAVKRIDGHDMGAIVDALDAFPWGGDKPCVLIADTVKGKGLSFAEHRYEWHSNNVTEAIYQQAINELERSHVSA